MHIAAETIHRPWPRWSVTAALVLLGFYILPPPLHRAAGFLLGIGLIAWWSRRLIPAPAWAIFLVYQAGIVVLCHADHLSELGCALLSAGAWGLGVPLWAWAERRARAERIAGGEEVYSYGTELAQQIIDQRGTGSPPSA